jgi:type II secretory pathway component GspD/PulD (secretin)
VTRFQRYVCGISLVFSLLILDTSLAQGPVVAVGPDGKPRVVSPGRPSSSPAKSGSAKPGENKPAAAASKDAKGGAAKGDETPPEPKIIRRGDTTNDEADEDEFQAMIGEDGRVEFWFRNQQWVDMVQWLEGISNKPLDWLELPADRVNMRSPGRYTIEQTHDLFNRYLLARGYTLLEVDSGLAIAKTEKINPAIVPRVDVAELASLPPHSFVRTSLDVGWLSAEKLTEELAPMISVNGRLTALKTTNRIEAMDAVVNLLQVADLLDQERNSTSREALAPEFKLRYLPAEEAKLMLEQFLGVEKKAAAPMTSQQMQMMQQMRSQNKGAPPPAKKVEISIVANPRQNSVIIRAPADRIAVAMEFLKRIDVSGNSILSLSDIQSRVEVYRLASLDPEKLIEIVSEMNVLEPTTRVRVDKDNNNLIVSGSGADKYIIKSLIERLDGSGRSFEVLPLRRLDAEEVAESIAFLMGQKDEKKTSSSRRSYYSYGYYGRDEEEKKDTDEFRVAANTRYRQVLLWANENEMAEVRSLLVKLGELPPPGGSRQTVRMIDASATPETYEYLQRLRQQWNRLSPNQLELPNADQFKEPNIIPEKEKEPDPADENSDDKQPEADPKGKSVSEDSIASSDHDGQYQLVMQQPSDQDSVPLAPDEPLIRSAEEFDRAFREPAAPDPRTLRRDQPPTSVRIELDSSGNLVLICPDTDALDRLENLMLQMKPPKRPYQVFHIEHASSSWMRLNLEDYYRDLDESDGSDADNFYRYYWGGDDEEDDDGPSGLGKGNQLRFVDDLDTNTLVVTGATGEQLRTIAELIELWDVPEPVNKRKTRFTSLVKVKYGKADKIAETVKEAYRDLLSSNDKAFSKGGGQGQNGKGGGAAETTKSRSGNGSGFENSDSGRDGGSTDFSFKGKLSLGIDDIGNTLLVSAEGEPLLELVTAMIEQLDDAARPQGEVQVMRLPGGISGESLQNALKSMSADTIAAPRGGGNIAKPAK